MTLPVVFKCPSCNLNCKQAVVGTYKPKDNEVRRYYECSMCGHKHNRVELDASVLDKIKDYDRQLKRTCLHCGKLDVMPLKRRSRNVSTYACQHCHKDNTVYEFSKEMWDDYRKYVNQRNARMAKAAKRRSVALLTDNASVSETLQPGKNLSSNQRCKPKLDQPTG